MMLKKKGQLFLIEVVIALSVLIVLISALFTVQSFDTPQENNTLRQSGQEAIDILVTSGLMYDYFDQANFSYYILGDTYFDSLNSTKQHVEYTVDGILPPLANFKIFTERYNETTLLWDRIDVINLEQNFPTGSEIINIEYYCPGFNGIFAQFTFLLSVWYEVSA